MEHDGGISRRKEEHVRGALELAAVPHSGAFDNYRVVHNALPEIALNDVDASCEFLGKKLRAPFMIASLTGGPELAGKINENLAKGAQRTGVPVALGSARIAIHDSSTLSSFQVRSLCPDVPLLANLGLVDLDRAFDINDCRELVKKLHADALIFHVNPLHEALQTEGNTDFAGLLERLRRAVHELEFPVIVKEVGHGISAEVFRKLDECGVYAVDVSGAGGTSWGYIEGRRDKDPMLKRVCRTFSNWGIPAVSILEGLRETRRNAKLIASGGIRSGVDVFKAVCLGADLGAAGLPFLEPALQNPEAVADVLRQFILEFRLAMFAAGCRDLSQTGLHLLESR
ncbi:MAG: type 2 isopentenyl-diphosphate Delta-isomerase [bacterium]